MGRRTNSPVDPVIDQLPALDIAPVTELDDNVNTAEYLPVDDAQGQPSHLPAFMLGTVIGALAGALLGTLVSPHTRAYLVGLYQLVSRRLTSAERDELRFELLLQ